MDGASRISLPSGKLSPAFDSCVLACGESPRRVWAPLLLSSCRLVTPTREGDVLDVGSLFLKPTQMHKFNLTAHASTLAFLVLVLGFAAFPLSSNAFRYMCHVRKLTFTSLMFLLSMLHYICCILTITLAARPLSD